VRCLMLKAFVKKGASSPNGSSYPIKWVPPNRKEPIQEAHTCHIFAEAPWEMQLFCGRIVLDEGPLVAVFMSYRRSFSGGNTLAFHNWFVTYHADGSTFLLDSHKESMSNHIMVCRHFSCSSNAEAIVFNRKKALSSRNLD
jgi:hypothetical protein